MIWARFRALRATHGVSRALVSRRTSKIEGPAPERIPPLTSSPLWSLRRDFSKMGKTTWLKEDYEEY